MTREEVLRLARLARLDLTEEEIAEYQHELGDILHYVAQLQAVDVDGLRPTNQVSGLVNVMRDDVVQRYGYEPADLLRGVPAVQDGQLRVHRMIA